MERKPPQKSTFYKIPIKEYVNSMNTELSKRKKREIIYLFNNYNQLCSELEFIEIRDDLRYACRKGDIDLIRICLSKTIRNDSNTLQFKIDETNRTASLIDVKCHFDELIIPRTVKHERVEYLITSILKSRFYIKTLKFAENSAVKTIYPISISPKIQEICFPASLKKMEEGWCLGTNNLTKITISPSNGQFIMKDEKCLLGKSDNSNEFDLLLFACRDIKEISIPSNIKIISSYAFHHCKNLKKVDMPPNSNLQTIESNAFSESDIEEVFIPPNVSRISRSAFVHCKNLIKVEIPPNSNLQIIEQYAFAWSHIREIFIPSKISKISGSTFFFCENLAKIKIPTNSNLKTIEKEAFSLSSIKDIFIPFNILKIYEYAFSSTNIKSIFIPSKISKICENAFYKNFNLQIVEISEESKLESFPLLAFKECPEFIVMIPASNKKLVHKNKPIKNKPTCTIH